MTDKVLIIYTGGTIGMIPSGKGYIPDKDFPEKIKADIGLINDEIIPAFDIKSMEPLLDSSNMMPDDWNLIAGEIEAVKDAYRAFIVLHGTDTMAYTASVLGFMLQGLDKTVIITGSQIPYSQVRNDARVNLISSLIICGNDAYNIPEVCLYFNNKLFRGCRTTKIDATHFGAFDSPNYPPLAEIGLNIDVRKHRSFQVNIKKDLLKDRHKAHSAQFDSIVRNFHKFKKNPEYEVGILRLFPGISARYVEHILTPQLKGLVIEAFGVGNGPTREKNRPLFELLQKVTKKPDTVIVAVTQCLKGTVILDEYAASLKDAGVISGYDMTVEAAFAKLYYLISYTGHDLKEVKTLMQENLIGELTRV